MQKKIVRNMTFSYYYAHTSPIFRDLKILTIDKLIVHRIRIAMYKLNNEFLPDVLKTMQSLCNYCFVHTHTHTRCIR